MELALITGPQPNKWKEGRKEGRRRKKQRSDERMK
jgi:hypothetical protein